MYKPLFNARRYGARFASSSNFSSGTLFILVGLSSTCLLLTVLLLANSSYSRSSSDDLADIISALSSETQKPVSQIHLSFSGIETSMVIDFVSLESNTNLVEYVNIKYEADTSQYLIVNTSTIDIYRQEMDEPKSSRYFRGISKSSPGPGNGNLLEHLTAIDASSTEKTRESALDGEMDRLMSSNGGVTGTDGFDDGFGNLSASNGCQGREEIDQRATDISVEHDTLEIEGEDGSSIEVQDDAEEATQEQRYGDSTRNFQQHQPEEIESSQETETTTTDRHFASTFPADANSKDDEADAYFNDDIMHGNVNSKNKRGKAIKTDSLNRVGNSSNRRERMPTNIPPEAMEEGDSELIDSYHDEVNCKENARSGMKRQALPIDMAHTSKQLKEQSKKSKRQRCESDSSVEKNTEIEIVDMT